MESQVNLRFAFVELLFALAIGQVGIEVGDLIIKNVSLVQHTYIYSHLFLGTVIIASSWVGWQSSKSIGNTKLIHSVFSPHFIILLVDIFLVICYFIIVRGAEIYYEEDNNGALEPNAYNETFWSMVIFITYFLWDIFTKLYNTKYEKLNNASYIKADNLQLKIFFSRSWQTMICLAISIFIYLYMSGTNSPNKIMIVDLSLVSLFFSFRGLKQSVKKNYQLNKSQIPMSIIKSSNLNDLSFPLNVVETKYNRKIFITKVLPFLLILVCIFLYFKTRI